MDNLQQKFGTGPVFFTAISTILGAIMFLRFGFAVGSVGLLGTFAIILIGWLIAQCQRHNCATDTTGLMRIQTVAQRIG